MGGPSIHLAIVGSRNASGIFATKIDYSYTDMHFNYHIILLTYKSASDYCNVRISQESMHWCAYRLVISCFIVFVVFFCNHAEDC